MNGMIKVTLGDSCYVWEKEGRFMLGSGTKEVLCNEDECQRFNLSEAIYRELLELKGGFSLFYTEHGEDVSDEDVLQREATGERILCDTSFSTLDQAIEAGMFLLNELTKLDLTSIHDSVLKVDDYYLHGSRFSPLDPLTSIELSNHEEESYCAEVFADELNVPLSDYLTLAKEHGATIWIEEEEITSDFLKHLTQVQFPTLVEAIQMILALQNLSA